MRKNCFVLNDFFECLRYNFSYVYNQGSEIISVVVYILLNIYLLCCYSRILLSRLSTITLDSRYLLSIFDPRLLDTLQFQQGLRQASRVTRQTKEDLGTRLGESTISRYIIELSCRNPPCFWGHFLN